MKVAELRAKLDAVPGDLIVLVDGAFDHGYRKSTGALVATVEEFKNTPGGWPIAYKEYWDDANMGEGGEKRQAFVVSVQ